MESSVRRKIAFRLFGGSDIPESEVLDTIFNNLLNNRNLPTKKQEQIFKEVFCREFPEESNNFKEFKETIVDVLLNPDKYPNNGDVNLGEHHQQVPPPKSYDLIPDIMAGLSHLNITILYGVDGYGPGIYDDLQQYSLLEDYLNDEKGKIGCETVICVKFVEDNGFDLEDEEDEKRADEFLLKHFQDNVPKDFPYMIQTEDYFVLWSPK